MAFLLSTMRNHYLTKNVMETELMKQFLFNKLKIGTAVTYVGEGLRVHNFYYVICKINESSQTVDLAKYSQATGESDRSQPIKENVSLDNIEFFFTKDKVLAQVSARAFFP